MGGAGQFKKGGKKGEQHGAGKKRKNSLTAPTRTRPAIAASKKARAEHAAKPAPSPAVSPVENPAEPNSRRQPLKRKRAAHAAAEKALKETLKAFVAGGQSIEHKRTEAEIRITIKTLYKACGAPPRCDWFSGKHGRTVCFYLCFCAPPWRRHAVEMTTRRSCRDTPQSKVTGVPPVIM